ncbi:MAG: FtsQ-type POTRA domain-containing protein [Myxococcales bacterium]|nr:MAG: FtsQ-type POTRA domain-containing protein [Myxococcales bacterium]
MSFWRRSRSSGSAGPEEPTVAINALGRRNFRRRRLRAGLRRWRAPIITVLVVVAVAVAVWLLYFSSQLTTRDVEVAGNESVSDARVTRVAKVPIGTQLARLDVGAIRARVESIAAIGNAEVSRSWPHTLRIEVTERVPAAVVERAGRKLTVDLDGVVFDGARTGLVRIMTSEEVSVEALAQGARVATALPDDLRSKVQHIELETIDKIEIRLKDGRRIVWGSAAHSSQKAEVAEALLRGKARVIDVTVPGRPTTR